MATDKPQDRPHMFMVAIDPPGENRRWQCKECKRIGTSLSELRKISCTKTNMKPCTGCGQAPFCASNCPIIWNTISRHKVTGITN